VAVPRPPRRPPRERPRARLAIARPRRDRDAPLPTNVAGSYPLTRSGRIILTRTERRRRLNSAAGGRRSARGGPDWQRAVTHNVRRMLMKSQKRNVALVVIIGGFILM